MSKKRKEGEPVLDTIRGRLKEPFETYHRDKQIEDDPSYYNPIRYEICDFYGVPRDHIFTIDLPTQKGTRNFRAFTVLIIHEPKRQSYYIDGRIPHTVLLRNLQNEHKLPFKMGEDGYEAIHGFIDPDGFQTTKIVKEDVDALAKKLGKEEITWFVRDIENSSPNTPKSPNQISL